MIPSAPTSARINLPNTATGFDLLDSCTILAAHIPGTTSSCTLSRLGLPHYSFMSSLRLVVSSICCTLLLLPPTNSTLFTFLAMSTLPAYFLLRSSCPILHTSYILLIVTVLFRVIAFSRYVRFHLYTSLLPARVLFIYYFASLLSYYSFHRNFPAQFAHRYLCIIGLLRLASVRPIIARVIMLLIPPVLVICLP